MKTKCKIRHLNKSLRSLCPNRTKIRRRIRVWPLTQILRAISQTFRTCQITETPLKKSRKLCLQCSPLLAETLITSASEQQVCDIKEPLHFRAL